MDNKNLANILFKEDLKSPEYYEQQYPPRDLKEGTAVTRVSPSPTGFLHMGTLYISMIDSIVARQTGGVFYLRIEDTDKKREVENGIRDIVTNLERYGIKADEGFRSDESQFGDYAPYKQSERGQIYRTFVKYLVENQFAYPCFCSEDELNATREVQEKQKLRTGYYGKWTKCSELSLSETIDKINEGKTFVIRLKSNGNETKRVFFDDVIKGRIEMPENDEDFVIQKSDGIPTYHFAHAIDDRLMRTTHVIRGDEWIASTPKHLQLFGIFGWKPPKYAHVAPIMKEENGKKRKISKRKDPEAAVEYYFSKGYPKESVMEYLMTISNSNFEDWRHANKNEDINKFPFSLKKMSISGALFDLVKLNDVSKNVISLFTAEYLTELLLLYTKQYDTEFYNLISNDKERLIKILKIDRGGNKPRKDIAFLAEIKEYYNYFYNELYKPDYTLPENINKDDAANILKTYTKIYNENDDKDTWFQKIKSLCEPHSFSPDVKAYKENPQAFKGHVGDVSTIVRIAITARTNTPDLHAIMAVLGEQTVVDRINDCVDFICL